MSPKTTLKLVALHILTGFAALCLSLAFLVVYPRNDLRLFSLATAVLFFLGGALRGAGGPQNSWLRGVLVSLGGAVPVVAMRLTGMAFTERGYVPLFIVFSLLLAMAGALTRQLLSRGRLGTASLSVLITFAAVTLAVVMAIPPLMARWSSEQVNRPAPSFYFVTLDGRPVASADLRGRVVVLAFWATWCQPCRQELPDLQKAYEQYRGNANVAFYAVGGSWGGDTVEKESTFAKRMGLDIPLVFDSGGAAQALGVSAFPALVILDADCHVRMVHNGYDASEHLARYISEEVGALAGK
jgi:peroxiredoxin